MYVVEIRQQDSWQSCAWWQQARPPYGYRSNKWYIEFRFVFEDFNQARIFMDALGFDYLKCVVSVH